MSLIRQDAKTAKTETRAKWRSLDPVLLLISLTLSASGILAVYVAGVDAREAYAMNQAFGFAAGLAAAIPLALIDYRLWQRYLRSIYVLVLLMLLTVLLMGAAAGGAQRWVDIGPVQVQPSEFAKLGVVIVLAGILSARAGTLRPKGAERLLLAQVVAISVAAYDLTYLAALNLAGLESPPIGDYAVAGLIPDVLLNAFLAYLIGWWLLKRGRDKTNAWED